MKEHAVIVIKNEDNDILFVKRSMNKSTLPGAWSFPSGTVEANEPAHETIVREAREEFGVEVEVEENIATLDLPEFSVRLIFVLCKIKSGEPSICAPDEIDEIEWMKFKDFFDKFDDNNIGHGLVWLRKNPHIWEKYS